MLSDESCKIIEREEAYVADVLSALKKKKSELQNKLGYERRRAIELTQASVSFRDSVDKELNSSSEAVSHARKASFEAELESLDKLSSRPYFGRLTLKEGDRQISFKLGYSSFSEASVVDWRKAPIAKLYYEYNQGDFYEEEVAGTLREGEVLEKCVVEIKDGELFSISTGEHNLVKANGEWQEKQGVSRGGSFNKVADVRGLLTDEQWGLINSQNDGPLVVSGVAGTGKTTAAVYRLSKQEKQPSLLLAGSESMRVVLQRSMEEVDIKGAEVKSFDQWLSALSGEFFPNSRIHEHALMPREAVILRSAELAKAVVSSSSLEEALTVRKDHFSSLLGADAVKNVFQRLQENELAAEEAALMLIKKMQPTYEQVLVDEVQDRSVVEILLAALACKSLGNLVLVGDEAQDTQVGEGAGIQTKLAEAFHLYSLVKKSSASTDTSPVVLNITHRGTKQIMKFAESIVGRKVPECSREGKRPLWQHCLSFDMAVERVLHWLGAAVERYPTEPVAVLTGSSSEASEVYSLLTPKFGYLVNRAYSQESSGIIVGTPEEVKGWEFACVLIWNPNDKQFSLRAQGKQRLYVAATRARDNLCVVTYGRYSRCLPSPHPSLVRFRDWKEVEEEALSRGR